FHVTGVQTCALPISFRLPPPIAPSDVLVRWRSDDGRVEQQQKRLLLPLALAPGGRSTLALDVTTPAVEGRYRAELALASQPAARSEERRVGKDGGSR